MERLGAALDNGLETRYLLLYGPGVSDLFISYDYAELTVEESLWHLLRKRGFDRIAFLSPSRGISFLDEHSCALSTGRASGSAAPQRRGGPLRQSTMAARPGTASDGGDGGGVRDARSIAIANGIMVDDVVRTAVVFLHAETLIRHWEARRELASYVGAWSKQRSINKNVSIWLFGGVISDVADLLQEVLPEMYAFLVSRPTVGQFRASRVGGPENSEMERLVDYLRLRRRLEVNWPERGRLCTWLAAEDRPAKEWLRIPEGAQFSMASARAQGWVEALPDDSPAIDRLDRMIGLASVKARIREFLVHNEVRLARRDKGLLRRDDVVSLHMVFAGNPGTGKTEVARLVGEILRDGGFLRRGHTVVIKDPSQLIAGWVGHTGPKTNEMIDQAMDGVLFIDEAYHLVAGREGTFNADVVAALLNRTENDRDRLCAIAAGYPDEMRKFIASNSGMPSRFTHWVEFPDYTPDELMQILQLMLSDHIGHKWTAETELALRELVEGIYRERMHGFGNARAMRDLAQELDVRFSNRIRAAGLPLDSPLLPDDIDPARAGTREKGRQAMEGAAAADVMSEMDDLVGLSSVKAFVRRMYHDVELEKRLRTASTALEPRSLHMAFVGSPGTGKSTVARLVGTAYRQLGLLRRGHVIEVDTPAKLVAGYVGQTAERTNDVVDQALDGVLFVDEAYQLAESDRGGFGREALDTIMTRMENERGRLAVIFAGYTRWMEEFLGSNPGLHSRIAEVVHFPDYSDAELQEILLRFAKSWGLQVTDEAVARATEILSGERTSRPETFGNARSVRNLFQQMKSRMASRLAESTVEPESEGFTLTAEDVP